MMLHAETKFHLLAKSFVALPSPSPHHPQASAAGVRGWAAVPQGSDAAAGQAAGRKPRCCYRSAQGCVLAKRARRSWAHEEGHSTVWTQLAIPFLLPMFPEIPPWPSTADEWAGTRVSGRPPSSWRNTALGLGLGRGMGKAERRSRRGVVNPGTSADRWDGRAAGCNTGSPEGRVILPALLSCHPCPPCTAPQGRFGLEPGCSTLREGVLPQSPAEHNSKPACYFWLPRLAARWDTASGDALQCNDPPVGLSKGGRGGRLLLGSFNSKPQCYYWGPELDSSLSTQESFGSSWNYIWRNLSRKKGS